jgi:hypothetical protein
MSEPTYEDFKSRISIKTVLEDAGYHFNRRDGMRYPSYIRLDNEGRRIRGDKFIVTGNGLCCFRPPERRNYTVISFIQEHPELFAEYTLGMDKNRLVNLVCNRLLGHVAVSSYQEMKASRSMHTFDISEYDIQPYDVSNFEIRKQFYPFFKERSLDLNTQSAFADHFFIASDKNRPDGKHYTNLAFPFRVPGEEQIAGLEERGRQLPGRPVFKGKAAGSNSVDAVWMATIGHSNPVDAKRLLWFESAFDAMAFYQIHRDRGEDTNGVYISTGGNPGEKQFQRVMNVFPQARHHLCFDRDRSGEMFACIFSAIKAGRDFTLYSMKNGTLVYTDKSAGYERLEISSEAFSYADFCRQLGFNDPKVIYHPSDKSYKDWNDQLLGRQTEKINTEQKLSGGFRR